MWKKSFHGALLVLSFSALVTTAHATPISLDGKKVDWTLAFGPNGSNGVAVAATANVGSGIEFLTTTVSNIDSADFEVTPARNAFLTITDAIQPRRSANGWEMRFSAELPVIFTGITLVTSNFSPSLTYGMTNNTLWADWGGTNGVSFRNGISYSATFAIDYADGVDHTAVPEPPLGIPVLIAGSFFILYHRRKRTT